MRGHNAGLVKAIGEPYEGKPHVRFDGGAVESRWWLPLLYPTNTD